MIELYKRNGDEFELIGEYDEDEGEWVDVPEDGDLDWTEGFDKEEMLSTFDGPDYIAGTPDDAE